MMSLVRMFHKSGTVYYPQHLKKLSKISRIRLQRRCGKTGSPQRWPLTSGRKSWRFVCMHSDAGWGRLLCNVGVHGKSATLNGVTCKKTWILTNSHVKHSKLSVGSKTVSTLIQKRCQVEPGDKYQCYKDLRSISAVRTANLFQANLHVQKAQ
jgi:hypothetical protein